MNLKGVVIDPGHGGLDSGAVGNGIVEKDLNLEISKYMYDRFRELGIPVKLTRDSDVDLTPNNRPRKILDQFGSTRDVIVISNHINAGGGEGAEVIYALRNNSTLASGILNELEKSGQVIRKYYQRRLPSDSSKDYYYVIRDTPNTEALIVEYGFLDNASDAARLKANYKNYAEAVVRAVANYANSAYVPVPGSGYYVVKKGDTLWSIASANGLTVNELKALNNLTSNVLNIGDTLLVSGASTPIDTTGNEYYTVKSGDTLYSIANKNNLTVDELKFLNNLTTNTLSIGQVLLISRALVPPSVSEDYYTVKSGDTLWNIASKYGLTVDELKSLNNLSSNLLNVGQVLTVNKSILEEPSDYEYYTVKSGDNLYSIATRYGLTVNELKSLNNLTTNTLSIGQRLIVVNASPSYSYTVKSGDTLYSIANTYNVSVDDLKSTNNLTANTLSIGQVLNIPGTSTNQNINTNTYTVVKGDSLYSIAKAYNTTVNEIKNLNNLTDNALSIGQKLQIPK